MLSETWLDKDECVSIPNFECCVQFKRPGHTTPRVAIYRKQKNSRVVTTHMDITYHQTSGRDSDEDIKLSESDCDESEEKTDVINYVPVNPDIYIARFGTEWIPHNSNVPGRSAT
ncbi:hypothetical protein TNCV_814551 [Trichonephila clavipes]|nr:hypothetical protein TNCV_814551 [Trichonephila clavipes]